MSLFGRPVAFSKERTFGAFSLLGLFVFVKPSVDWLGPEISSDSRKSLDHRDPFGFLSLDTSLDIETVILKS